MTRRNQELYDNFQLFYNNVSSNQAPGLTLQEISTYLSNAQNELVQSLYRSYEADESARKALAPLVVGKTIASSSPSIPKIVPESMFFKMPKVEGHADLYEVLYVLYEAITKDGSGPCYGDRSINVYPVPHDEFHTIYRNPFRYNNRRALRFDVSDGIDEYAEIVCKVSGTWNYFLRYIRRPTPIILWDGEAEEEEETAHADFFIDGYDVEIEPVLDHIYDNALVSAAAQIAYQHYKS